MRTLREGMRGDDVAALQAALAVDPDGVFGQRTALALADWQASRGLYADGVFGPLTRAAMHTAPTAAPATKHTWARVDADPHSGGYDRFTLRDDVAQAYTQVRAAVAAAGGVITSAGGRRNLTASVGSTRSATSLHYLGRALDLALYSGMVNPDTDPYIVTLDDAKRRLWRVWVRVSPGHGEARTLDAWTYQSARHHAPQQVTARVLDLTELFGAHGFDRIPARPQFFGSRRNDLAAEWWHFQYEVGLTVGATRFGDELERVWSADDLEGSGPWALRAATWAGAGFAGGA